MTAEAISRRTTIPLDLIQTGIVELLKPDDESRTPTLEGRRIVPLVDGRSWGWHIVNYKHYRELKREEDRRDYHRKYWAEKRSTTAKIKRAQQRSTASTKSTEAYAEAEAVDTAAFASFYEAYPKKQKRKEAESAWKRLKTADQQAAMQALPNFVNSPDWAKDDGKFIPYPASWINGRRWEDLIESNVVSMGSGRIRV
jgi:hypothetical protein